MTEAIPRDSHETLDILTEEAHENPPQFQIINMETNNDMGADNTTVASLHDAIAQALVLVDTPVETTIEPVQVTNQEITTETMTTENFTLTTAETTTTTSTTTPITTSTTTASTTTSTISSTTTTEATTTPQPFCESEYCRYISSLAKEPQEDNRKCLDLSKVKCTTVDKKLTQVITIKQG